MQKATGKIANKRRIQTFKLSLKEEEKKKKEMMIMMLTTMKDNSNNSNSKGNDNSNIGNTTKHIL